MITEEDIEQLRKVLKPQPRYVREWVMFVLGAFVTAWIFEACPWLN